MRFVREGLALLPEAFELLFDFAQRRRLRRFALLQTLLINFQLFFERFDQGFDGFLALFQIALSRNDAVELRF